MMGSLAPWMKQLIYRNCIHLSPQADSVAVSAASEKDRLSQSAGDSALVQTCEKSKQQGGHHHANAITIMGNVTITIRDRTVFSQNRSQSFQKGSSLLQSNFLSEQEPIIPEQEPIISEQEPNTSE